MFLLDYTRGAEWREGLRFGPVFDHPFASFYGRCSKSMIFLGSFWWCVTFGSLFGPPICFLLLIVFKKGIQKGSGRTIERTDATNGLTEYFRGLYLRATIHSSTSVPLCQVFWASSEGRQLHEIGELSGTTECICQALICIVNCNDRR